MGRAAITQHVKSEKHQRSIDKISQPVSSFFFKITLGDSESKRSALEATFAIML